MPEHLGATVSDSALKEFIYRTPVGRTKIKAPMELMCPFTEHPYYKHGE
jgi:hypothetical protein